ncbi:hypothetical protein HBI24_089980 [Parastagonospora nodorum]|nr:hypothetical protein HBI09_075030 [Parastagonospora nodorum]KAH4949682.1 hypothetical protein HBH74_026220 [Parastagonospora nodorum]KAH4960346.1 hypothetical protein HBH73_077500 [Parastagonospora nodorum]KAH5015804.1 hypothetical protein HBI77_062810 [Parastagonospora nodorum]KAH5079315.1 hypothetical protein HBH95_089900 [Parastagonospora nodorum]
MSDGLTISGLGLIDDTTRQKLGQVLWGWVLCGQCSGRPSCTNGDCPWHKADSCEAFWTLYHQYADAYIPERLGRRIALDSHQQLVRIIATVKSGYTTARKELLKEIFNQGHTNGGKPPTSNDQNQVFNIAASLLLLMDFGVLYDAANLSSGRLLCAHWRDDVSADVFIKEAFPLKSMGAPLGLQDVLPDLRARKLSKHAKLKFQSTNDIRRHLVLDKKDKKVWIFHQTSVLRQLLAATKDGSSACILPRQLVLEVLDTLHVVLFPSDIESQGLLAYLVIKYGWDKGLLDGSTSYRNNNDPDVCFDYFGDRLEELVKEMRNPTPHGWLQRRLKRKEDTYMLMVAMYGVIVAVVLGFLSLVAAIFQSWVTWQQWKHPVN